MRHFEIKLNPAAKNVVGQPVKHESAIAQVQGKAPYVDDAVLPQGALHAYPVLSPVAKGKLLSIDASALDAISGYVCMLTAADIVGKKDIGPVHPGDVLLAENEISYHAQPVAVVVAESYEQARIAARAVVVEVEETAAQVDVKTGLKNQDWVRPPYSFERGDIDTGFAAAPHRLQGELSVGGQEHFYLEGQIAMAMPAEEGGIFVKCSTQHPSEVQHLIAEVLGLPMNAVTIEMRRMGGAFGGKETQAAPWAILAAMACRKTGRAVKLRLARAEDFKLTGKRHPFFNRYEVGFDDQGRILAADIEVNGNCGYSPDLSDSIVDRAMFHSDNCYFYENVRVTGQRVKVDTVSHTAFRGFGGPQGMITAEAIMDDVARYLGKDPLDVRKANLYQPGRDLTPYHQKVEQFVVGPMIDQLCAEAEYHKRRQAIIEFNKTSPVVKKGLAVTPVKFGISFTAQHLNQAGALVHVYYDGSIHLNHGGTEMGQGLNTKVRQIVAQVFGVNIDRVGVSATRTDKVPNTSATAASSGADLNGMAALNAATTIKDRLIDFIAEEYAVAKDSIHFENDEVVYAGGSLGFAELAKKAYFARIGLSSTGFYSTPKIYFDRNEGKGRPFFYFSHGVALTEVEVDTLTGENCVTAVDVLHDVGKSLNPALDIGQIEGAFVQGMGWLTTEQLHWRDNGELMSVGPATYKIPAIGDTPKHFDVKLYDSENPEYSVFRSKAVGEPPFMLANSVWCALRDAVASISDYRYSPPMSPPALPETILNAVNATRVWLNEKAKADQAMETTDAE
ncbi:xanthine dehydrogenase molybdopterin binding subunit [Reinekea marinisedimentorum]|uniref:Xanthine dehydrogenase large subunit n=1 Tax=Reinekea marinisedimentorum TaxID=230495 RepID=A0A4V2UJ76_9GAMM|nr:xanthine dehydrogenase molybdopterin binding subunit [Reinekea marinisedimentorum]TCS38960.1 xanthine dehydrogenase large subunit [Reinekea marinisedimentorum]